MNRVRANRLLYPPRESFYSIPKDSHCYRVTPQYLPFLALIFLQFLDAGFTIVGISQHGISIEGNFILRQLFYSYGVLSTLLVSKLLVTGTIAALFINQGKVRWISAAVWGLAGIYFFAAVIPWGYLLIS